MPCLDEQTVVAFVRGGLAGNSLVGRRAPPARVRGLRRADCRCGTRSQSLELVVRAPKHHEAAHPDAAAAARGSHWTLPPAAPGGPGRRRRGLRGLRPGAGPESGHQDPARRRLSRRGRCRPPAAGGAGGRQVLPPQRRDHLRRRHPPGSGVPDHGADRGRDAVGLAGSGTTNARGDPEHVPGRRPGPGRRPPRRHHPPRLQTPKRDGRRRRNAAGHGLRAGGPGRAGERTPIDAVRIRFWGRRFTCPRNSCAGRQSIPARTSSAFASRSIRLFTAPAHSKAPTSPSCARPCSPDARGRRRRRPAFRPGFGAALLRGLAVDKTRRFPDMDALLSAIAQAARPGALSPALGGAGLATVAVVAAAVIVWQLRGARSQSPCTTTPPALAQAWPTTPDGQRRAEVRASFLASGVPDAQARHDRTVKALDDYAAGWAKLYRQNCEAEQMPQRPAVGCFRPRRRMPGPAADRARRAGRRVRARGHQDCPQGDRGDVLSELRSNRARTWLRSRPCPHRPKMPGCVVRWRRLGTA